MHQSLTLLVPNPGPLIGAEGGNNDISYLLKQPGCQPRQTVAMVIGGGKVDTDPEDNDSGYLGKQGEPRTQRHREMQNLIRDVRETKGRQLHVPTLYTSKTLFHQTYSQQPQNIKPQTQRPCGERSNILIHVDIYSVSLTTWHLK